MVHADACRAHVHGGVVVVERRRDADALSWNSRVEGAEHLALFTSLILPRALAVFVRYPTRIAHAFGTSRRFSPDLPYAATCNRRVSRGTLSGR